MHSLQGQFTNLVGKLSVIVYCANFIFFLIKFIELLHKPIAWLQKNALVQYDLLKYSDCLKEDEKRMLQDAVKLTQNFLNDLNLEAARKLFSVIFFLNYFFIIFENFKNFFLVTRQV